MKRLYVVVRSDLPAGLQLAQACHAIREFTLAHPGADVGDNLVALSATAPELQLLATRGADAGIPCVAFYEPDVGNEMTAVAFSGEARQFLSCLPLALRAA